MTPIQNMEEKSQKMEAKSSRTKWDNMDAKLSKKSPIIQELLTIDICCAYSTIISMVKSAHQLIQSNIAANTY